MAVEGAGRERAAAILKSLYARLEAGESVTLAEVDSEIRFTEAGRTAPQGSIRTASGRITRPRSPAQAAYLELMRTNPLVFGVGPAGTGKTYLAAAFAAHMLHERRVERASSCRAPPSRRASGWAFCPATSARRSIPICARSPTRSSMFWEIKQQDCASRA